MPRRCRRLGLLLLLVLAPAACGSDAAQRPGELSVLAAASLTDAFEELGRTFEDRHPGVTVTFSFGGSSALARQLRDGAPADVFVAADEVTMGGAVDAGDAVDPALIARNRLALLVERGNPKGIVALSDLARGDVVLVLCAPEVPCGRLGAAALRAAGVSATPASLEANVKAVVAKVALGEADAGIVYASDLPTAGGTTEGVAIDGADDPGLEARYLAAVTSTAVAPDVARAWIDHLLSPEGQAVLARHGFLAP